MTETLIAGLHSDTLKVSSLSAVRRYAALEQDALAAGRELGVQAVLEGYIQRDDERLRVSTRLLNVADGRPLWSARFNEAFNDIFAVQDAVAAQVLAALTPDIVAGRGALRRYTNDPEAYEHYIAGRYYRAQPRTDVSLSQALAAFERAVARDPNFALAHAGIGEAHSVIGVFGLEAPDVAFPRAQRAVARALALAPDLGEIYAARGHIQAQYEFDWRGAQESFERAIRLAPNYAPAWQWRGILFGFSGRFDAALRDLRRAQQLEPASPTYSALIGMLLMYQRRYDEAIAQLTTTLQQDANLANANTYLTATYLRAGRFDAAAAQLERTRAAAPGSVGHYGQLLALTGRRDAARAEAQRLADLKRERYVSAYDIATIHATLGDSIRTLDWLERALEERAQLIAWLPWEPVFDGIRQEPRYRRLVARLDAAAVVREPGPTSETTPAAARSPR
jgi:tetratricopeptide (TPR) repeat protein